MHILLAVTGMSPQVITETLFAIHQQGLTWPDELCLVTTARGRAKVWEGLVAQGHLAALCRELGRTQPSLSEEQILVVPNAQGEPVDDARSVEDHEALADFITQTVREKTADAGCSIHASIAGGRKTMTFYLGYAMSLFGRPQDSLSHVLVSEAYEGRADFYYPTRSPQLLALRTGDAEPLDAQQAQVTLADIPFVRQRTQITELLESEQSARLSYRKLTQLINLGDSPELIRLRVDENSGQIEIFDVRQSECLQAFSMASNLLQFAFFLVFVDATLNDDNDLTRPAKSNKADQQAMAKILLETLYRLLEHPPTQGQPAANAWHRYSASELAERLLDMDYYFPLINKQINSRSLEALKRDGLTLTQFSNFLNAIQKLFNSHLPANLSHALMPAAIRGLGDERGKQKKGGGYQLPLNTKQIELIRHNHSQAID